MEYCETCKQGTTYNGWTNRETWACKLWLDNSPETYNEAKMQPTAHALESFTDSLLQLDDEQDGVNFDNMRDDIGSVWRVNFKEIWDSYEDDRKQSTPCPDCAGTMDKHTRASCNE